jgi:hypothetical protein
VLAGLRRRRPAAHSPAGCGVAQAAVVAGNGAGAGRRLRRRWRLDIRGTAVRCIRGTGGTKHGRPHAGRRRNGVGVCEWSCQRGARKRAPRWALSGAGAVPRLHRDDVGGQVRVHSGKRRGRRLTAGGRISLAGLLPLRLSRQLQEAKPDSAAGHAVGNTGAARSIHRTSRRGPVWLRQMARGAVGDSHGDGVWRCRWSRLPPRTPDPRPRCG